MRELEQLGPALIAAVPAERGQALVERLAASECPALTARRARRAERSGAPHDPIVWTRALGVNVWDADGNRYVDLSAGFGAAAVGHSHPDLVRAVQAQVARLAHALGDLQPSELKIELLDKLRALAPFADARVMLGLSGSDAVTAALKTAMLHTRRPGVLAFEGGYHGLDYGPLAACGYDARFRTPFAAQLNPHVCFAPYPGARTELAHAVAGVERAWRGRDDIGAVLIEPILGRGGVVVPPAGFLPALGELCQRRGALLVCDEVLSGLGRAGAIFDSVAQGARPDLICLGKGLGGGLPISACIGRAEVMASWGDPGSEALHTGTFFGNPLACAAALATLAILEREALPARALELGREFEAELRAALGPRVREVRGRGLLLGIELASGARGLRVTRALLEHGYITVPAGSDARVLSLTPPLTIGAGLLRSFATTLVTVLDRVGP
jgi:4-aminobutyrate aminotransferase / (S)-3-amino-2-methylpropionate transaminase / 5-aminovalerate transaminase